MTTRQKIRLSIVLIAFFLFPAIFYYMSPYLIIDASLKGIISGSFILFTLQFLSALIIGRAFCGWVCPAGGSQEAVMFVLKKRVNKFNFIKWIIWTPWIVMIIFVGVKAGGYSSIDPTYQTEFGMSMTSVYSLITYLLVLSLITIPAFIIGRRSFCHHLCWMAPFMILGRKIRNLFHIPALQLNSISENCIHCHACTEKCPMSLEVEYMVKNKKMENSECILCLTCVDGCKSKAIKLEFKTNK
jgi:polyferredoxin